MKKILLSNFSTEVWGRLSVLQDPPFTDQGNIIEVFTDISVWMGIRRVIEQVNANALAA